MDYFLSVLSVAHLWLMGNKWKYAPMFGIVVQVIWIYYSISSRQYGLLIGSCVYLLVNIRNTFKWIKESKKVSINDRITRKAGGV